MKIGIKGTEDLEAKLPFPKLMISRDQNLIVLFKKPCYDTVISGNSMYEVGYFSSWDMYPFEDLKSTIQIILQND